MITDTLDSYKETEIGQIPQEWEVAPLSEVASLNLGQSPPSSTYNEEGEGPPFLQGKAQFGAKYPTPVKWCSDPKRIADLGSVLISVRAPVGDVNIADDEYCIGRGLAAISGNKEVDNQFLFYLLTFEKPRLEGHGTGSTFKSITKSVLQNFAIAVPPLPEQRRIAHVLNTIQREIEVQDQLIAGAQQLKRSLMRHLFTYGPVPIHQTHQVELQETNFGSLPRRWQIVEVKDCAFVQTGVTKGRSLGDDPTITVPYLRVANVQDGYLDLSEIKTIHIRESELDRYSLEPGDVVLTEGGDFDKLGRGFIWNGQIPNCIHQNHIFAVRVDRDILSPEYFSYLLQSSYAKSYFLFVGHRTTNLATINKTKLESFSAPVPSRDEQEKIVEILTVMDRKIQVEEDRKSVLEELFNSMLHQLMTGKLRVPEPTASERTHA